MQRRREEREGGRKMRKGKGNKREVIPLSPFLSPDNMERETRLGGEDRGEEEEEEGSERGTEMMGGRSEGRGP